ncbi:MAG: hypothetical protein RIR48_1084 [Bacteroidota bacterium]
MSIKTSYSQTSSYIACPKYWFNSYELKYKPEIEGSSLYFGTAVDASIMALLEKKPDYMEYFKNNWFAQQKNKKPFQVFDNDNIVFGNYDFDEYVLKSGDEQQLLLWASELNVGQTSNGVDIFKEIAKNKKNPYKKISKNELKFFNRASWLSLHRKGELLIEAFKEQFLPKVKKVHATQQYAKVEDPLTGDVINGYIDMILSIEGYDSPIIFDLKTSSQPYKQEQIDLTEQLTLYAGLKAQEYNTNLVGYVVLVKNITKETENVCVSCGNKKTGKHKTCEAMINNTRCNGNWTETKTLKPEVQILVQPKTIEKINELFLDYENVIKAMKEKIIYKNTAKCNDWYGQKCVFYDLCHKGDDSNLKRG